MLLLFPLCMTGACWWVIKEPVFSSDASLDGEAEQDQADTDGEADADMTEGGDQPTDPQGDDAPSDVPADEIVVTDWPCRRPLAIDNGENTSDLQDFQIRVDVEHDAAMNADFSDIRFGSDGLVERYAYWIEEISGDGSSARVWVKVPFIGASAVTLLYLFYGRAAAADEGDPEAVFEFYDDFESGTLDKWAALPDDSPWSVSTDLARSGSHALSATDFDASAIGQDYFLVATGVDLADMVFESALHVTSVNLDISQTFRSGSSLPMDTYEINLETDHWVMARMLDGHWTEIVTVNVPPSVGSWFRLSTVMVGTSARMLVDDAQVVPSTGWVSMGNDIASGSAGYKIYFISPSDTLTVDDVWVRRAADPFPSTRWGDAQCL